MRSIVSFPHIVVFIAIFSNDKGIEKQAAKNERINRYIGSLFSSSRATKRSQDNDLPSRVT